MFTSNQKQTLHNKFSQVNQQNIDIVVAPGDIRKNQSFTVSGRSVTALMDLKRSNRILIFLDSNSNRWFAIPEDSSGQNNQRTSRTFLSRHTQPDRRPPTELACELLNLAYMYYIRNPETFDSNYYLVDFNNNVHHIITIPGATNRFYDSTFQYFINVPPYTYHIYETGYISNYNQDDDTFSYSYGYMKDRIDEPFDDQPTTGSVPATQQLRIEQYGFNEFPVVPGSTTVTWTNDDVQDFLFPGTVENELDFGVSFDPTDDNIWDDRAEDDEWLEWNSTDIPGFAGGNFQQIANITLADWFPGDFYFGEPNPQIETTFSIISGDTIERNLVQYGVANVSWQGSLSTTLPPGQQRPPPEPALPLIENYMTYQDGVFYILIKSSGDRPSTINPGDIGYASDTVFNNVYTFKFDPAIGQIESSNVSLPFYLEELNVNDNDLTNIAREFRENDVTTEVDAVKSFYLNDVLLLQGTASTAVQLYENRVVNTLISNNMDVRGWEVFSDQGNFPQAYVKQEIFKNEPGTLNYEIAPVEVHPSFESSEFVVLEPQAGNPNLAEPTNMIRREEYAAEFYNTVKIRQHPNSSSIEPNEMTIVQVVFNFSDNTLYTCHQAEIMVTGLERDGSFDFFDHQ